MYYEILIFNTVEGWVQKTVITLSMIKMKHTLDNITCVPRDAGLTLFYIKKKS